MMKPSPRAAILTLRYTLLFVIAVAGLAGIIASGGGSNGGGGPGGIATWAKTYGDVAADRAFAVEQSDDDGDGEKDDGFIIAGSLMPGLPRTIFADGAVVTDVSDQFPQEEDLWVQKLDALGEVLWSKVFGDQNLLLSSARSVQRTADGNLIVAGTVSLRDGNIDIGVVKMDLDGHVLWRRLYDSNRPDVADTNGKSNDTPFSIRETADGGFIVAGESEARVVDDQVIFRDSDLWIFKLDREGHMLWQRRMGNSRYQGHRDETARSVRQTSDGGYIVAGYAEASATDLRFGSQFILVKLDSGGVVRWSFPDFTANEFIYDPDNDQTGAWDVIETQDGWFAAAGWGSTNGVPDYCRVFTVNADGGVFQEHVCNGNTATGIRETADGDLVIAGGSEFGINSDIFAQRFRKDFVTDPPPPAGLGRGQIITLTSLWREAYANSPFSPNALEVAPDGDLLVVSATGIVGGLGNSDFFILRLDPGNGLEKQRILQDGPYSEVAHALAPTEDGFVVAGAGQGSSVGDIRAQITRFRSDGAILWERVGERSDNNQFRRIVSNERATAVRQTADGHYLIAGYQDSPKILGGSLGVRKNLWLLKLNAEGELLWEKVLGGTEDRVVHALQETADGGLILAGYADVDDTVLGFFADLWVLRLDASGNVLWEKVYGGRPDNTGVEYNEVAYAVQQTDDGGFLVAGYLSSDSFSNAWDIWVLRLDADGQVIWQKRYGGTEEDVAFAIQPLADGNYLIVGSTRSYDDGGPECPREFVGINPPVPSFQPYKCANALVLKIDGNGNVLPGWPRVYGGGNGGDERAYAVQPTGDGHVVVAGYTRFFGGGFDCDIRGATIHDLAPNSSRTSIQKDRVPCANAWLLKLNAESGDVLWHKIFGTATEDLARAVRATADGGFILAGETNGITGSPDAWVLKIDADGNILEGCPAALTTDSELKISSVNIPVRDTSSTGDDPASVTIPPQTSVRGMDPLVTLQCAGFTPPPKRILSLQVNGQGTADRCGPNATCASSFEEGTVHTLSLQPEVGWQLQGITGDCSAEGVVVMDGDKSCAVTFTRTPGVFILEISRQGDGVVTSDPPGIDCGPGCTGAFDAGTVVTLTALAGTGQAFEGWSGACAGAGTLPTAQITLDSDRQCGADFTGQTLTSELTLLKSGTGSGTVTSSPAGIDCGAECSHSFDTGTVVTLTAAPDGDSDFSGWSGDADCADGEVTMGTAKSCTATFTLKPFVLTVLGHGNGTITSSPAGIDCGAACVQSYPPDTVVTLTAVPDPGWQFDNWGGILPGGECSGTNPITQVTMTNDKFCPANFSSLGPFTLTVNKAGTGTGTVTSSPAGIDCGSGCSASYSLDTLVTLSAAPDPGSTFTQWMGDLDCADGQVRMDDDLNCTAVFSGSGDYTLTLTILGGPNAGQVRSGDDSLICTNGAESQTVCTADYPPGTMLFLYSIPSGSNPLATWTGCDVTTVESCELTLNSDRAVSATFP